MRVFLAGGTGAIGKMIIPRLLKSGHEVTTLVRSVESAHAVESQGAKASIGDPLEKETLVAVVRSTKPDVIIHQLTALAGVGNFKKLDEEFALTNRFRTEVTDTLLEAARLSGAKRFLVQSYCGWPFAREGGPVKTEEDPLDPDPPVNFRATLAAIRHLEDTVRNAKDVEVLALRYGNFYGPGTGISKSGPIGELVKQRKLPIVGSGAGVWSFIHVEDAARATVAAISRGAPGIFNVVDDEPAPISVWLPELARALGAAPPRRIPVWLGKLAIGEGGVAMMTEIRGGSNVKAKRELGWEPRYSSWRRGFVEALG